MEIHELIESTDPKTIQRPLARCRECDRVTRHYNEWLEAGNNVRIICWECKAREEKGFNAKRDFRRTSRFGVIPR